jgi:hypothetical protein
VRTGAGKLIKGVGHAVFGCRDGSSRRSQPPPQVPSCEAESGYALVRTRTHAQRLPGFSALIPAAPCAVADAGAEIALRMDTAGGDGWAQAFPWLVRTGKSHKLRRLLAEAETVHRDSALLMRILGREDLARRAEWYAARARFDLDEPEAARRLYSLTRYLGEQSSPASLLDKALEGALSLSGAERGNVQVLDPATGSLRIAAQHGFGAEFLDYFAVVNVAPADQDGAACGRAARERAQIVIADVNADQAFERHRGIAAATGFRAVQSTPLVDRAGRLVGVVSTHYPRPGHPPDHELRIMKRFGELVGAALASRTG